MAIRIIKRFIKSRLHGKVAQMEADLGVESPYLHFIVDTCVGAFMKFILFTKFATHRRGLPADAAHIARIVTSRSVDCGTCVQVAVNLALADGVRAEWIQAVLDERSDALPAELRDVRAFTEHVLRRTYEEGALRETLRERYGSAGLVSLSYAIAGAQVFPMIKQVLGYATTCARVEVTVPTAQTTGSAVQAPVAAQA